MIAAVTWGTLLGGDAARSPLAVPTARAVAQVTPGNLIVEIRSADEGDAAEILGRAQALAAGPEGR